MKKYYVAYYPCTEDLSQHHPDQWIQVNEHYDSPILCICGDLQMVDVVFEYPPVKPNHRCKNKVNRGYALGHISYVNQDCNLELKPTPIPNTTLYRLRWHLFGEQYRFCIENKNGEHCEMDYVDQLLMFRGIPYVSNPRYEGALIEV